jgi:hypothetical protein
MQALPSIGDDLRFLADVHERYIVLIDLGPYAVMIDRCNAQERLREINAHQFTDRDKFTQNKRPRSSKQRA